MADLREQADMADGTCAQWLAERWLPVVGYDGFYEVSHWGRVRSLPHYDRMGRLHKGRIRKPSRGGQSGYQLIHLSAHGEIKALYVHRMVMEAFAGPCPEGQEVLHGDDDVDNNRLDNLSYGTHRRNAGQTAAHDRSAFGERNGKSRLTEDQVREIRLAAGAGVPQVELAMKYGVSKATICRVVNRYLWKRTA